MTFVILWLTASAFALLALRHLALRDFGVITVGGLIGLVCLSLAAPVGLILALILSIEGRGTFFGKVVWTRDAP